MQIRSRAKLTSNCGQSTVALVSLLSVSLLKVSLAASCSLSLDDGYCEIQLSSPFMLFGEESINILHVSIELNLD